MTRPEASLTVGIAGIGSGPDHHGGVRLGFVARVAPANDGFLRERALLFDVAVSFGTARR